MSTGDKILAFFQVLNQHVGEFDWESYRNYKINDQDPTKRLWDGIGRIIGAGTVESFKKVKLFDGSLGSNGDLLPNHFIPDRVFYNKDKNGIDIGLPSYQEIIDSYKNDHNDGTMVVHYDSTKVIPDLVGTYPLQDLTKEGLAGEYKGYRIVIFDRDITENSFIRYSFIDNSEDVYGSYIHKNVGSHRIVYQKDGEFCIYVEESSCVELRYGITTETINIESNGSVDPFNDVDVPDGGGTDPGGDGGGFGDPLDEGEILPMPQQVINVHTSGDVIGLNSWYTLAEGTGTMNFISISHNAQHQLRKTPEALIKVTVDGESLEIPIESFMINQFIDGANVCAADFNSYWQNRIVSSSDWKFEIKILQSGIARQFFVFSLMYSLFT